MSTKLNQYNGGLKMTRRRKEIQAELIIESNEVWQSRPNTAVKVTAHHKGKTYSQVGFSKVNWPDWWNAKRGVQIARGKALVKIARTIEKDERCAEFSGADAPQKQVGLDYTRMGAAIAP
jgi:hypothetical protein